MEFKVVELLEFVLMRNGEHSDAEVFESLVQVQLDELISDSRRGEKEEKEVKGGGYLNIGGDTVGAVVEDGVLGAMVKETSKGHALLLARREIDLYR